MSHNRQANENLGKLWTKTCGNVGWEKQICNFVVISLRTFERFVVLVPSEILSFNLLGGSGLDWVICLKILFDPFPANLDSVTNLLDPPTVDATPDYDDCANFSIRFSN